MSAKSRKLPPELETIRRYALYAMGRSEDIEGLLEHPVMFIIKGNELYRKGNYSEALNYYRRALSKDNSLIEARVNMAFAYVRLGEFQKAKEIFENLLEEYRSEYVLNNLGNIYAREGDLDRSMEMYRKALEKNGNFVLPIINIANLYMEKEDYDSARKYLKKALEKVGDDPLKYTVIKSLAYVEYFSGNCESSLGYIDDYLKHDDKDSSMWLLRAECLGRIGKIHEAEKCARKAYEIAKNVESLTALATIALEKGEFDEAIKLANKALKMDSEYSKIYVVLAKAYYLKGDYEKSLHSAILGLKYRDRLSLRIIKAESLRKLGKYDEALEEINRVIERKKDYAKAYIIRSHIFMDKKDYENAENDLNKAKEIEESFELYTSYARLYEAKGDKRMCANSLKRALEFREDIDILRKLCDLLYELGEFSELSKYLEILTEKMSEYSYGWYMRGEVSFHSGEIEAAEKYYLLSVKINPNFVDAYLRLAVISLKKGDEEKAKEYMEKVVSLSPERRDVWSDLFSILMDFGYYEDIIKYIPKAVEHTGDESLELYGVKALISLGRYEEALGKAEELEKKMPGNRECTLYKGIALYHMGKYSESLEIFESLREEFEVDANYYIAKIYLATGRAAECLEIADKYDHIEKFVFLKMDAMLRIKAYDNLMDYLNQKMKELSGKALTDAMFYLVRLFAETGNVNDALVAGQKILERDPNHYDTLVLLAELQYSEGNFYEAMNYAEKALNIRESEEVLAIYAKSLYYLGNYEKSLDSVERLLQISPSEEYRILKGNCLFSLGKYEEAMNIAKEVLSANSKNTDAHLLAGKVSYALGNYDDAVEHLTEVLMYNPENWEAYYYRGMSYFEKGDYTEASTDLDRALIAAPDIYEADILEKLAEAEFQKANYQRILNLSEDYGIPSDRFRILLGSSLYHIGDYEKSVDILGEVKDESLIGEKLYYMALSYLALDKLENAELCLREAEEHGKVDAQTLYYHAMVLFKLKRYEEAYESFKKYLEQGGEEKAEIFFNMALCLYEEGRCEEAIKYFERAEVEYEESFRYEGICLSKLGRYQDALTMFDIAEKKGMLDGEAWYYYGLAVEKIGKDPLKHYEKCWEMGYRNEEIAYKLLKMYREKGITEKAEALVNYAGKYGDLGRKEVAKLYILMNKYEDMLKVLEGLEDEESKILRAKAYLGMNMREKAVDILMEISDNPEASYLLVKVLVEDGRYEDALKYVEKGKEFGNLDYEEMLCHLHMKNYEKAEEIARAMLSEGKEIPISTEILGLSLFMQGKYEESVEYLAKAYDMGRDVGRYLGEAYYKTGNYDEAIKVLQGQEDENSLRFLALSYYKKGDYLNALKTFEKIPMDDEMKYYAGISAYRISDYAKAAEYLEGIEKGKEELADSYFHLGKYDKVVELNPKNSLILGISLFNLGRYDEAYNVLKDASEKSENKGTAFYYLALASLQLDRTEEAKEYMEKAKMYGYEGDLSTYEGIISFKLGDYAKAAKLLSKSKDKELRKYYAISLYHLGDYRHASIVLKNYGDEESRKYYALCLMAMKKYDVAAKIFENIGDKINAAKCMLLMGRYDDALSILEDDVSENARRIKFECLIKKGMYEEALNIYETLPPEYKENVAKDVCEAYLALKMYSEAEKVCDRYFNEHDFEWWYIKARVEIARGRYSEAINSLNNAKKIEPQNPNISKLMAGILLKMGDYENALKEAKKAVKELSEDPIAWYNLGLAYYRNERIEDAKVALEEAAKLDEKFAEAWELLSTIYLKEGEFEDAYRTLKKALDIEKKHSTLVNMGIACYELEKYDEALYYLNEALKYREDHLTLYYKALVLIELDRKDEAQTVLRKVIKMKPDFVEARKVLGDLMGGE